MGQKRTYERHLPAAGGQAVRDIKPTYCSSLAMPILAPSVWTRCWYPGELMAEHAPSRQGSLRQPGFAQGLDVHWRCWKKYHNSNNNDHA
jgi:hypothetical protein